MTYHSHIPATQLNATASGQRRWRILFVITSSDVGGTETFLQQLLSRLDRREFDPVVCSLRACGRAANAIAAVGTQVTSLGMSERPRIRELTAGLVTLVQLINQCHVDLVQSFLYRANSMAGVAARFSRRRPVVVAGQRSLYPLGGRRAALAARWTRRFSDRVVAVSTAVREELLRTERIEPKRIVIIGNGVDTSRYNDLGDASVRNDFGHAADAVIVGGVGRLSREKGFHHLVESVADARGRGISLDLVLAGDGPERTRLELQAQALQLDEHTRFLGVRRDLRPLYASIDVFALPSLEEGSPNALLEAMACGRAVVASRVGGVPEIVEHERSGLLVDPGSPRALADAIVRLSKDPALRHRLGQEARRQVRERFDISRTVGLHAQLYRELLRSKMS